MEMDSSLNNISDNEKISKVLQKILVPNFEIKNGVQLNLFLTRLVGKNDNNKSSRLQGNEQLKTQLCQWIIQASDLWEKRNANPPEPILLFALNLTSQLCGNEQTFFKLNYQNVFESLIKVAEATSNEYPSVTVGIITLFCSFLEHKSGVQWVMATLHRNHLLNLGLNVDTTTYIKQKVYQFIVKLLEKIVTLNRNFTVSLIKLLTEPLKEVLCHLLSENGPPLTENADIEIFEFLKPTLNLISEVLTILLTNFNENVLQLFLEQEIPDTIEQLFLFSQNQDFTFELLKIQFVFLFYNMRLKLERENIVTHDSTTLHDIKIMFDLIYAEMNKNNVRCVVKICEYAHNFYDILAHDIPLCIRNGELIEFQTQMVIFQIMTLVATGRQLWNGKKPDDELRKHFIKNLFKSAAIKSLEILTRWRSKLLQKPDLVEDATFCLQFVTRTKKHFSRERAAKTFTVLVYIVNDIINALRRIDWTPRYMLLLKTILDTMVDLVETFDLTWKDTVETIRVMDLACEIVRFPDWADEIIVIKGLKLLLTAVAKYMSPNMILLIYSKEDSTVSVAGSLLYTKCHNSSWEIRHCALEVVYALSANANTKFPALTNVLLNIEFPQLIVKLALSDDQSHVRATAFKCLQELIQIEEIWDVLINLNSFLSSILNVLENESEGKVRQEAATVVCTIYEFRNFPDDMLLRLYDAMTHAAIGDLCWKVKCNALEFWFQTWRIFLTSQGMIDQSFPSHTFSKELKKIIALTDKEVNKRIIKVLNQLSQIGCLYVMKCAVLDNCDEVSKKAMNFTLDMLKMFRKYKLSENCENMDETFVLASNPQNEQVPANPFLLTPFSSDYFGDDQSNLCLESYFDPVSCLPSPISPSLDMDLVTPPDSEKSPNSNTKQIHQDVSTQASPSSIVCLQTPPSSVSPVHNPISDQNITLSINSPITPNERHIYESVVDICEFSEVGLKTTELENLTNITSSNSLQEEKILEDLINLIDIASFEETSSSPNQVINDTNKMKTKTFLAPSEYVQFVYNEVEKMSRTKAHNNLDEFDALLNEILKEYNIIIDN